MIKSEREQFLQHLALFSDLKAGELRELAVVAQVVQFPASALATGIFYANLLAEEIDLKLPLNHNVGNVCEGIPVN